MATHTPDRRLLGGLSSWTSQRPLTAFVAVALPIGWLLLSLPPLLGLAQEPFVLATLLLALLLPAVALTHRLSGRAGTFALLRDAVRLPRPLWWGPVAVLTLPTLVWAIAAALGGAKPLTPDLLVTFAVALVAGAIVINIWEEMVWTGFVQRRAIDRWGAAHGSLATALLFAGIHAPLAFGGARTPGDVLLGLTVLVATAVGLRLLIARIDVWTGRSLLTIGLLHAAFNATAGLIDPAYDWIRLVTTVLLGLAVFIRRV